MTTYQPQHPALAVIMAKAPRIMAKSKSPQMKGQQWAIYSTGCLWWTTYPRDCSRAETGLGCCPWCQAPLQQMLLPEFLEIAEKKAQKSPNDYGPPGLTVFILAHHRSKYPTCRKFWPRYLIPLPPTPS